MSDKMVTERQRKAYLALWTGFVMTGNQAAGGAPDAGYAPLPRTEVVKYIISPAGRGQMEPPAAARNAYEQITPGLRDAEVLALLENCILEEGEMMDTPDKRICRFYFQIAANTQFWLEFALAGGEWRVVRKSPLEAKCVWHRYADNLINLPLVMA